MAVQTWILTDVANGTHKSDFCINSNEVPGGKGNWRVTQRTLQGGLSEGVDLVEIDNGRMRLMIVPTRGMGIWKAKIDDETLGWNSPVRGPVHPKFVPLHDPSGLGWLEGFDEFVVRCGLESNGAPEFNEQGQLLYPLHGRIANRPAHHVEVTVDDSAETITVRGIVEETRFHFQKLRLTASVKTSFDSSAFTMNDEVKNYGGTPAEMQMLYHINLGEPLLSPGDRMVAPVRSIKNRDETKPASTEGWDLYGDPIAGQSEECFFFEMLADDSGQIPVLLKNAAGSAGTVVKYDAKSLPCFTQWKNEVARADGYVTGLEPGTNFPNERTVEARNGRVVTLQPGEIWSAELSVERLLTANEVSTVEDAIRKLKD